MRFDGRLQSPIRPPSHRSALLYDGRAAYRASVPLWMLTRIDEWKAHGEIEDDKGHD